MTTKQQHKKHTNRYWFSAAALGVLCVALISVVTFIWLVQPVFSVPWRSYSVELLPDQAYQRNVLWQASQKQHPSLATHLAVLPLKQSSELSVPSLGIFHIPARYEPNFCTGDQVLLKYGQQQSQGILRLKIAAGEGQQHAQFGIELSDVTRHNHPTLDKVSMRLQRLSYQPGDWQTVRCSAIK
ncbi:hypothetical protein GCM10010919_06330 [Alishewanella longhuensis]|uniref:Uncharacterized protein n=1 Tax=Alishewanella longhuensis TaxID=1091037 RepID=A0ABQ3KUB0_9ALTE|nr:hypothetical protein [Alishewanella longhuensis]GHG61648.1 hypothetical protein GCM10010919_06330 [Alishewanella longhuensis]